MGFHGSTALNSGPKTSTISVTQELVRNANSWVPLQTCKSEYLRVGPRNLCNTLLGHSSAGCLRGTVNTLLPKDFSWYLGRNRNYQVLVQCSSYKAQERIQHMV